MKLSTTDHNKIKKELSAVWSEQADFKESRTWQANTMRQIRRIGPLDNGQGYFLQLGQNIWRLAPVACILIIALTAMVIRTDFFPQDAVLTVFDYDMEELILKQVIGL
ncbi:MAG: hypothetical protein B6I22_06785 [Desulfobacteraceae bacterium 4572_123]|nr:MAG: hypothetical protein B6I22_06785 [Desulfobacteraceae bacterium 4572_123]